MEDDGGGDEKLLAVPSSKLTMRYDNVKTTTDLPAITLQQIEHFFAHYKDLEPGKWVKLKGFGDVTMAQQLIVADHPDEARVLLGSSLRDYDFAPGPSRRRNRRWAVEARRLLKEIAEGG